MSADDIDVFISYATKDAEYDVLQPYELAKWLEAEGYRVWWDLHMQAGDAQKQLLEKVKRAKCVIALYSPRADASRNVYLECQTAAADDKLLPFIIEGDESILPPEWRNLKWLQLKELESEKNKIRHLLPASSGKHATVVVPEDERISLAALPTGASIFIGREDELARLATAWSSTAPSADPNAKTNVLLLHAIGGAGKSALIRQFLDTLADRQFEGAAKVYAWSAYSQGSGDNRAASADEFIAEALEFFGYRGAPITDPVERGRKLAALVGASRSLLILDGMEPLQDIPHINGGRLKDRGLAALITTLAASNKGLLLLTSRQELPELASGHEPRVIADALDCMGMDEGVKLLAALGVDGKRSEMKRAVEEVLGHALSLNLLGSYLSAVHGGDINQREQFCLGEIEDADADFIGDATARYAKRAGRIMEGTLDRLGEAETAILHMVGLFDRPAEAGALEALLAEPVIPGLTDVFHGLSPSQRKARWNVAVERLSKLKPLLGGDRHQSGELDAHPIVRAHFGDRLKARTPDAYREAHSRLYDYYRFLGLPLEFHTPEAYGLLVIKANIKDTSVAKVIEQILIRELTNNSSRIYPIGVLTASRDQLQRVAKFVDTHAFDRAFDQFLSNDFEGLRACLLSIPHGCAAGRYDEAFCDVYWARLARGYVRFMPKQLGAMNSELSVLSAFFDNDWEHPNQSLKSYYKALILCSAGFTLRAVGRLREAVPPLEAGIGTLVVNNDWFAAAEDTLILSELHLCLGNISSAIDVATNSVTYSDRCSDARQETNARALLADVLHQAGRIYDAHEMFVEAEAILAAAEPMHPRLYSLRGYRYCDLLLAEGREDTVLRYATDAMAFCREKGYGLHAVPLHELSLARAHVALANTKARCGNGCEKEHALIAQDYFEKAVDGLRRAGHEWMVVPALLARAAFSRTKAPFLSPPPTSPKPSTSLPVAKCASTSPTITWKPPASPSLNSRTATPPSAPKPKTTTPKPLPSSKPLATTAV